MVGNIAAISGSAIWQLIATVLKLPVSGLILLLLYFVLVVVVYFVVVVVRWLSGAMLSPDRLFPTTPSTTTTIHTIQVPIASPPPPPPPPFRYP